MLWRLRIKCDVLPDLITFKVDLVLLIEKITHDSTVIYLLTPKQKGGEKYENIRIYI